MGRFSRRGWSPSEAEKAEFKAAMEELEQYIKAEGISASAGYDSFYFEIGGQRYRVSNHSVEASNAGRCDKCRREHGDKPCSEMGRGCLLFHEGGRQEGVRYIHAGKKRLVGIHKALLAGKCLDGRGNETGAVRIPEETLALIGKEAKE